MYPSSDFSASHFTNGTVQLNAEVYRLGRIMQDVVFVCRPILYGQARKDVGNEVYYYEQNQSMLTPILESQGQFGYGTVHTSDLLHVFGNLSKFDIKDFLYHPQPSGFKCRDQESRSWSTLRLSVSPHWKGTIRYRDSDRLSLVMRATVFMRLEALVQGTQVL